jgi:hypothetical protein
VTQDAVLIFRDRWQRVPGSFDPSEKMTDVAACGGGT